ncbi:50S ribosomal protein L13 [Candidatus Kaiserbacteria bacterium RIFCSPHIGHO2_02_FULL_49_11]|uniref:50S ribosomal protein L13 n=1 Tax=Candidatus Kaiserbacteria bacterium RIFCSPHIGHO2_02_FULL_49_11 TaxID=1798489 RepID=A0A1F6CYX8_9BACT|nr:MAG: 50S ribosomal protein L13 [Candidatus Kaiserbacteria bacterium RIFCSPHIGHO2_02_FULL_49_11]
MEYLIDAQGKKLGRVAAEAAHVLLGKHTPHFTKHLLADVSVRVVNTEKIDILPQKSLAKKYMRYSGYPGGLKEARLIDVVAKGGMAEVLHKAVYGMLPGNRLRAPRMKRLIIEK